MSADKDESSGDEVEQTIAQDLVVTKYNMAAEIVNVVLKELIGRCTAGSVIGELCDFSDSLLTEKTAKVFKKEKDVKKGIAFPTCVNVNHVVCHYSPLKSEAEVRLEEGDLVKVDLGAHIDGFIAVAAHTFIVGAQKDKKINGRKADVILAAYECMEVAVRMLRPGVYKNMDITDNLQKVAEAYNCKPVENMLSHNLIRNKIDGEKRIIQNPGEKQRSETDKCEIGQHEVYAIDVLVSTGEGKSRDSELRTTLYKKVDDLVYSLKMKASRAFLTEADKKFGSMPFTLRLFDDEVKAKMGIKECVEHGLMIPYPVLEEHRGEVVAQFKCTVLVMPSGLLKITGLPLEDIYQSEFSVKDEKLLQILNSSLKPSKKKSKAKKGKQQENEKPTQIKAAA